jgi:hypothetical protein
MAESARDVVDRYAPDVSSLVFAQLEARIGAAGLDARLDAAGAGAQSLLDKLRAGVPWMSELPPPLARVLRLARKVSDPVDAVARALGAIGSREVSTREVLGRAQDAFAARLVDFTPGIRAGHLVLVVVANLALWIVIKLMY